MNVQTIKIADIDVYKRMRKLNQQNVEDLAASLRESGLESPILVSPKGIVRGAEGKDGYVLVAGNHRLKAAMLLGWQEIHANVVTMDANERVLAEIDENLIRSELTVMEKANHLLERKKCYERIHPQTARGVAGGLASGKSRNIENDEKDEQDQDDRTTPSIGFVRDQSFVKETAAKTGISASSTKASIALAKNITPATQELMKGTAMENSNVDLNALAKLPAPKQMAAVKSVIAGTHKNVRAFVSADTGGDCAGRSASGAQPGAPNAQARRQVQLRARASYKELIATIPYFTEKERGDYLDARREYEIAVDKLVPIGGKVVARDHP